jgi:hypothetical protein
LIVDMGTWHDKAYNEPEYKRKCSVCFAGAVMAQTCRIPSVIAVTPGSFDEASRQKFNALNYIRGGEVAEFYECLNIQKPETLEDYYRVTAYEDDPKAFKSEMRAMATLIKKAHRGKLAKLVR